MDGVTASAAPISPPVPAPYPEGAAVSAHREPSFGATASDSRQKKEQPRDEKGPIAYSPSGKRLTVKDPPTQKSKPPPRSTNCRIPDHF